MLYDGINLVEGSTFTNLAIPMGTAFPINADQGEMFFRTDLQQIFIFKNSAWQDFSSAPDQLLKANFTGPVVLTTGTSRFYPPGAIFISKVYCSLGTVGSSTAEVDVKVNGYSIFQTIKPSVPAGGHKGTPVDVNSQYPDGSFLTVDVTQASGSDLTVYILYRGI